MPTGDLDPHRTLTDRVRAVWPDALVIFAILAFWAVYVGPLVVVDQLRGYDICRDAAAAINIQNGQPFADPAYAGQSLWYPPLSPAIVAGVSSITGASPIDCYRWSQLLFNWLLPLSVYLLTRLAWGRVAGAFAVIAFLLAMPWWQMEAAHGQPAIHSVAWGAITVLLYTRQETKRSLGWALATGLWLGTSFWHHPFVPTLLTIAFTAQGLWSLANQTTDNRKAILTRHTVLLISTALLAGPLLYLLLRGPVLNPAPRQYLARELMDPHVALFGSRIWLWIIGIIGLISTISRSSTFSRLLICCMVVALLGQLPGYLRLLVGDQAAWIPVVVPHEFQRLFQLTWAIAIGVGCAAILKYVANRPMPDPARKALVGILAVALAIGVGGSGLRNARSNLGHYLAQVDNPPPLRAAAAWIRDNTDINDVFACDPQFAFTWLSAETGRKVWLVPAGHSNPRLDWNLRAERLAQLRDAPTPEALWRLARDSGIRYLIPTMEWQPQALFNPARRMDEPLRYFRPVGPDGNGPVILEVLETPIPNAPAT